MSLALNRPLLGIPCLLFSVALAPAFAAEPLSPEKALEIDAVFSEWDRWDSPGAAVAILDQGEIVYERGYGIADLETRAPITPATIFHVASVSKQFTDFAVVLLEQDGKLDLDDEVRNHVAEVPDFGHSLTLRHLARHTSGLRDQWELLALSGTRLDDVITTDHILQLVARQRELNFEPGAEYLYSNTGFTLLAVAVARISGEPFPNFCHDRIFRPLGMTHTHFHDDHRHLVPGRAYSYESKEDGGWQKSVLSFANVGATSLFTTVGDLARWLRNLETHSLGGDAAIESMLKKGVLNDGTEIDYALGLVHGKLRGLPTLSHGGADAGFRSTVLYFPDQKLGIVVLANAPAIDPGRRASEIAALFLGDRMEPLPPEESAALADGKPTARLSPEILESYAGAYRLEELGAIVEISRRKTELVADVPGTGEVALVPISQREFLIASLSARLVFADPQQGRSPSVLVRLPGQEIQAVRIEPLAGLDLSDYEGWYLSPELETLYRISRHGDGLVATHVRNDDIELVAVAKDEFQGNQWFFGSVKFEREPARDGQRSRVTGFRESGGRVRNLWFRRVDPQPLGLASRQLTSNR